LQYSSKASNELKDKIEKKEGLRKNMWLGAFYILTPILIILTIYIYYEGLFK